ncbi:hypothetical protein RAC89_20855 [Paenibacillus sp. GD4]|jgi:hypothetical protein|uniref:hypothetical protein n=1 Tax=Paenibacillus TaxID=44249 RepID=UPI002542860B|nr:MULTISPECIES: hypothetical protein [Paenibacillus]MDQ1912846.1 hypothetical protein [Paenibacillus sp. GD4]
MSYAICYKGKLLSQAMDREQAEAKLQKLSTCFIGLELVEVETKTKEETAPPIHKGMNLLQIMEA